MARKKVAVWIKPQHRINVELIANVYKASTGKSVIAGWKFFEGSERISVYEKNGEYKIVFKGTSNPLLPDLIDDFYLAIGAESSVELIKEGNELIESLLNAGIDKNRISLTGHSLGGYAANSVGRANSINSITFNAAAPPTYPIDDVNLISTNYHIVGDIISAHMSDKGGLVIRANKNTNFFNTVWNHGLDRFYADDFTFSFWDANMENSLFKRDQSLATLATPIGAIFGSLKDIPDTKQKGFKPYFQDTTQITKKEINAAWKGTPLNTYIASNGEEMVMDEADEPEIQSRSTYNETLKRRIEADDIAFKRHNRQLFQYNKTLKSSLSYLKKPSTEPILWRTRKEYNQTMLGRVSRLPTRQLATISNKNV